MKGEFPGRDDRRSGQWNVRAAALRTQLQSPSFRRWLRLFGLVLLLGGATGSIYKLDIRLSELRIGYLLVNLLVLSPLLLAVAGSALKITAWALGHRIPLSKAVQTAAAASLAELLPLPGGAFVRGAALVRAGATMGESAAMITLTAVLTLSMTFTVSAVALALMGKPVGWWLALAGSAGVAATLARLSRRVPAPILGAMVAIRILTLLIGVFRLATSFLALGTATTLVSSALYTVATTLGSTVAIVPAGFGVNETVAALLATFVTASPAAAFLAVALNRSVGLVAGAGLNILLVSIGK